MGTLSGQNGSRRSGGALIVVAVALQRRVNNACYGGAALYSVHRLSDCRGRSTTWLLQAERTQPYALYPAGGTICWELIVKPDAADDCRRAELVFALTTPCEQYHSIRLCAVVKSTSWLTAGPFSSQRRGSALLVSHPCTGLAHENSILTR